MIQNFKLRVFRVVADTLNFRRAADELHLTQPAITAQIKSLEESLGIALFDRIGRDINLTPAGSTLLSNTSGRLRPLPMRRSPRSLPLEARKELTYVLGPPTRLGFIFCLNFFASW
jgi:hypothetical protein